MRLKEGKENKKVGWKQTKQKKKTDVDVMVLSGGTRC